MCINGINIKVPCFGIALFLDPIIRKKKEPPAACLAEMKQQQNGMLVNKKQYDDCSHLYGV